MTAYRVAAVVIVLGLAVSACDQGGRGEPFGGMAAASPGQFNNPDLAPVGNRDPVDSPATSPGGTATLGSYDSGSAQQ